MAWQLINTKTNEVLHDPGPLPENWGPVQGLAGFLETHGDLSVLGDEFANMQWVCVPEPRPSADDIKHRAMSLLTESAWTTWADAPLTVDEKRQWVEYRKRLWRIVKNMRHDSLFPTPPKGN